MLRNHNVQPSKKANGYPFNVISDGPNWTRAFHHILFLTLQSKNKNQKNLSANFPRRPFLSALFIPLPYSTPLHIQALDISLQPVDTREKNQGRKHVVWQNDKSSSRLTRKMVEISFPSFWKTGGDPAAATPSTISCPGAVLMDGFYCGERLLSMGARVGD